MARLDSKVAAITGGAQGIGKATAELFAHEGARVVIADINETASQAVTQHIRAKGGESEFVKTDVLDAAGLEHMVEFTTQKYGRLDILMNNAFVDSGDGTALEVTLEAWERHLRLILTAAFLGSKFAIPHMIKVGGGSIISTSSVHAILPADKRMCYATCKAGLIMLMKQIAIDYGPYGIRANSICPGFVETEGMKEFLVRDPWKADWRRGIQPLRQLVLPQDIAQAALFFASDESRLATGQVLVIDGGMTIQLQDFFSYRIRDTLMQPQRTSE